MGARTPGQRESGSTPISPRSRGRAAGSVDRPILDDIDRAIRARELAVNLDVTTIEDRMVAAFLGLAHGLTQVRVIELWRQQMVEASPDASDGADGLAEVAIAEQLELLAARGIDLGSARPPGEVCELRSGPAFRLLLAHAEAVARAGHGFDSDDDGGRPSDAEVEPGSDMGAESSGGVELFDEAEPDARDDPNGSTEPSREAELHEEAHPGEQEG